MAIDKKEVVTSLTNKEEIYMSYSTVTKHPYVVWNKEISKNQVYLFAQEADVITFNTNEAKKKKVAVTGMKLEKAQYLAFFNELYTIGANAIVWHNGEEPVTLELTDIIKEPDLSELEPQKRPLYNRELQLSGIYFIQEMKRTVAPEDRTDDEKKVLKALDARFCANLGKAEYIMVMLKNEEEPEKVKVPFIKTKDEKVFQPIFSDILEYRKYVGDTKNAIGRKVKFTDLIGLKLKNAEGYMLNPAGLNMPMTVPLMENISKKMEAADALRKEAYEEIKKNGQKLMDITNKLAELTGKEEIFVAYSAVTKHSYVTCDPESFNDQVWAFATEEEVRAFGKKVVEEKKQPVAGMKYEKKNFAAWIDELYLIGVNSIVWNDGEKKVEFELSEIGNPRDFTNVPPEKRPLINPVLQLSGIYFMQELNRPNLPQEEVDMDYRQELQEEMLVNVVRAEYLMAVEVDKDDPKKVSVPFIKTKDEKIIHPIFSDIVELEKFTKGKKMKILKFPFKKLPEVMVNDAFAYAINPLGINIMLPREQVTRLANL